MEQRRRAVGEEQARVAARAAARHLEGASELAACRRLALHAATGGELPSRPLYELGLAWAKTLLWPRVDAPDRLAFARCPRWEDLRPGRYGVLEPPPDAPEETLGPGDLVLVPGLAFDAEGRRLGRGGGHYDRALAAAGAGVVAFGVGYEFQRVARVPAGPLDRRVHGVLTDAGLWRVRDR